MNKQIEVNFIILDYLREQADKTKKEIMKDNSLKDNLLFNYLRLEIRRIEYEIKEIQIESGNDYLENGKVIHHE